MSRAAAPAMARIRGRAPTRAATHRRVLAACAAAAVAASCSGALPGPLIGPDPALAERPGPRDVAYAPGQRWRCTHRDTVIYPTVDFIVGAVDPDGTVHASVAPSFHRDLPRALHAAFTPDALERCAPRLVAEDATPFSGFETRRAQWAARGRAPFRTSPVEAYWLIVAEAITAVEERPQ
jgi:hypothetical protein